MNRGKIQTNIPRDVAVSGIMQSLRRIFRAIQNYSHKVSEKYGITGPQLWVIKTISLDGRLSLGDLGKRMYLQPSTITGLIDVLERKGYVGRARDPQDRRVVKVQLTPKGQQLAEKAPYPAQGKMIYGLRKLKKDELNLIFVTVQKLVEMMEAQKVKVTFFDQE
jgi:DNA-binding MarR family transcriptional regulator